ncbi:binuclear zinc transcription factor, partial [Dactylonectria macrodidyma]
CHKCRSRRLKCDREVPSCGRCIKSGHECSYPTSRQAFRGKRKHVRDLETQLSSSSSSCLPRDNPMEVVPTREPRLIRYSLPTDAIRTGLFERLPPRQLIEDLATIYFDRVHHAAPILHRQRFFVSLHMPTQLQVPTCLQYIVMALGAASSEIHRHLCIPFYQRARAYAASDETQESRDASFTLAHAQFWLLAADFEAEHKFFSKAATSLCRGIRVAQILHLYKVDEVSDPEVSQDWLELEEKRRTWWALFCADRFIRTLLPASEEAYQNGSTEKSTFLSDDLQNENTYSSFAGRVLTAHIFHRTVMHTSQNCPEVIYDFLTDPYWDEHRKIDNDLASTLVLLPESLRLSAGFRCQNAVLVNIMMQTAIICLHRAALWRMQSQPVPDYLMRLSQARLLPAAEEVLNVLKIVSDLHKALQNPLINFAAYVAASVFLEDAHSDSGHSRSNLEFLLRVMVAIGKNNPVTGSLATQLADEMKQCGIESAVLEKV